MTDDDRNKEPWNSFLGPNLAYIHEQYERSPSISALSSGKVFSAPTTA
jgi:hypothetical protein